MNTRSSSSSRRPLSNLRHNVIHEGNEEGSASSASKSSQQRPGSKAPSRFRLKGKANDTPTHHGTGTSAGVDSSHSHSNSHSHSHSNHGESSSLSSAQLQQPQGAIRRSSRIPRAAMAGTKASQMRAAATADTSFGNVSGNDVHANFNSNNASFSSVRGGRGGSTMNHHNPPNLNQSVQEMKLMRAEAQQKRMDWASKRRGGGNNNSSSSSSSNNNNNFVDQTTLTQGDIIRAAPNANSNSNHRTHMNGNGHNSAHHNHRNHNSNSNNTMIHNNVYRDDGSSTTAALSNNTDEAVAPGNRSRSSTPTNQMMQMHAHHNPNHSMSMNMNLNINTSTAQRSPTSSPKPRSPSPRSPTHQHHHQQHPQQHHLRLPPANLQRVNSNGSKTSIRLSPPRGSRTNSARSRTPTTASTTGLHRVNSNGSIQRSPRKGGGNAGGNHGSSGIPLPPAPIPTLNSSPTGSIQRKHILQGPGPVQPQIDASTNTIKLTRDQLEQIIQDRVKSTNSQLEEYQLKMKSQQKQIEDLKFFQELDGNSGNNKGGGSGSGSGSGNGNGTGTFKNQHHQTQRDVQRQKEKEKATQEMEAELNAIKSHLHKTLTENSHLSNQVSSLKNQNIDLQANLQACNPPMSSPDAYKKALRLQSDLLDAKNVLQEEILRRERAETNLECLRMESESQISKKGRKISDLESALDERSSDLNDGVAIMKSMEEEMLAMQDKLQEEHEMNQEMKMKYEAFEKEKNSLADRLRKELEASKQKLKTMEERFDREKGELEENCDELTEEIEKMKVRAKEMEEKRKVRDQKLKEMEKVELEQKSLIQTMKQDHEEEVKLLKESLEKETTHAKECKEKITAMEEVVSMYHEKARAEIQEYSTRAEEADKQETEAREELQECLDKVDEAEKEINSLLDDLKLMKHDYDEKEKAFDELKEKHEQLSETFKANNASKARDHQHMREKKKWAASEKQLREELALVKKQFNDIQQGSQVITNERDQLDKAFNEIEEENAYLKSEISTMEQEIEEFSKAEEEYMSRTKSLEQELVRLQNMNSRASPTSAHVGNAELKDMKMALRSKDQEIEQLQKMANNAMTEVNALKRNHHPSPNERSATPRISNASPTFDAFNTDDDEVQRFTASLTTSPSMGQPEWDEMDNATTSRKFNSSSEAPPSLAALRESAREATWDNSSVTPEFAKQERRAIENDAIRSYMRHRRRQKRN